MSKLRIDVGNRTNRALSIGVVHEDGSKSSANGAGKHVNLMTQCGHVCYYYGGRQCCLCLEKPNPDCMICPSVPTEYKPLP